MYTHLEDFVQDLYKSMEIYKPEQLDVGDIAKKLKLNIYYSSTSFYDGSDIIIKESTTQKEWQTFGHEVCHHLRHYGSQLFMHPLFIDLQEFQATQFAYHFCVPTFMLENLKEVTVHEIMNQFNVEYEFAARRLEMYQNKVCERVNGYALQTNRNEEW